MTVEGAPTRQKSLLRQLADSKVLLLMCLPAVAFFIVFNYMPLPGAWIAFTNFNYRDGANFQTVGSGNGFDVGLAAEVGKALRLGASVTDMGQMTWDGNVLTATDQPLLVAHTTAPSALRPTRPAAADEPRTNSLATAIAVAPAPVPTPEIVPAALGPVPSFASAGALITVDVRNGNAPAARPARIISSALAEAAAPDEHRRLGGRLLQQASHLVRGERVSLAEVTGLPENVTLRATIAGRSVSKSIRL